MMRIISVLALIVGASALQKPSYGEMFKMTVKSRTISDVTLENEEPFPQEDPSETSDSEQNSKVTSGEMDLAKFAFAGFVILTAALGFGIYRLVQTRLAVASQNEEVESPERNILFYNKAAPAISIFIAFIMFFAVTGGVLKANVKVDRTAPKSNFPGYEGQQVAHERMDNPGERAFFAAFGLVLQAVIGTIACFYLRKSQEVQISTSIIMKMACRGAVAGALATMFVEFLRLPFQDYLKEEELVIARVIVLLLWVAAVAVMEEVMKIGIVALGLKRTESDQEAIPSHPLTHFIAESPQALAICGLAAGVGFAFIENIPRFYAVALNAPLVALERSYTGNTEKYLITEDTLRSGRLWTFFFWGVCNIQPFLTGLAAMQLAKLKAPISPMDWAAVLKVVCIIHFVFDLLDRSASPFVEFIGCCLIPFAMHRFYKQYNSEGADPSSLLTDHE